MVSFMKLNLKLKIGHEHDITCYLRFADAKQSNVCSFYSLYLLSTQHFKEPIISNVDPMLVHCLFNYFLLTRIITRKPRYAILKCKGHIFM